MNFERVENSTYSDIVEYSVRNAHIGCYGYITKGLENLSAIMPSDYSRLPLMSIGGNYIYRKNLRIQTPALSVVNSWYSNFYHFIYETLIKVFCLRDHLPETPIVFPSDKSKFHDEWLSLLDIDNVIFISSKQVVKTPLAISCNNLTDDMRQKGQILRDFKDWVIEKMKTKGLIIAGKEHYPEKLFINRSKARFRRIVNNDEVLPIVKAMGYTVIELEDYSLAEQINFFYHAQKIAGAHGAGFSHMAFTQASVLDIIVEGYEADWFEKLAKTFDVSYTSMRAKAILKRDESAETAGHRDLWVDTSMLHKYLEES